MCYQVEPAHFLSASKGLSMDDPTIKSPTNQTIKELVRLKARKGEWSQRAFLVEGAREIERAISQGFILDKFFVCQDLAGSAGKSVLRKLAGFKAVTVAQDAFSKVATRDSSDGVLAVFMHRTFKFEDILKRTRADCPFIVAIESVEKPGNLGAILRSADGAGVHGVVILGQDIDIWNPNVIRASLGGIFSVPTVRLEPEDFFAQCKQLKIKTVAAALSNKSSSVFFENLKEPVSVIFGSEAHGLSDAIIDRCDSSIVIPMKGVCDSLNVSVAAGIVMYETLRQRMTSG